MRKKHVGAATPTDFLCASPRKYRGAPAPRAPMVPTPLLQYIPYCNTVCCILLKEAILNLHMFLPRAVRLPYPNCRHPRNLVRPLVQRRQLQPRKTPPLPPLQVTIVQLTVHITVYYSILWVHRMHTNLSLISVLKLAVLKRGW